MERFIDTWPSLQTLKEEALNSGFVVINKISGILELKLPEYCGDEIVATIERKYENHKRIILGNIQGKVFKNDVNDMFRYLETLKRKLYLTKLLHQHDED